MVVDCQRAIGRLWAGVLALVVMAGAGCDPPDPPDAPNQKPRTLGIMPDDTIEVGDTVRLNVANFFEDPDTGDVLVYTAKSSDESKVAVVMGGAVLTYIGMAAGESVITVTATDPEDESAEQKFEVVVLYPNRPPVCGFLPPTDVLPIGVSGEKDVPCSDPDEDEMTYTVESSDPDVVSVSLRGESFDFETVGLGTATVTVTATDPEGLTGEADWTVTVVEAD